MEDFLPFFFTEQVYLNGYIDSLEDSTTTAFPSPSKSPPNGADDVKSAVSERAKETTKVKKLVPLLVLVFGEYDETAESVLKPTLASLNYPKGTETVLSIASEEELQAVLNQHEPFKIILSGFPEDFLARLAAPKHYETNTWNTCLCLSLPSFEQMKTDKAVSGKQGYLAIKAFLV